MHNFGAGDVVEIRRANGKTFMVPMRPEAVSGWDGEALTGFARRILALNEEAVRHFRSPPIEGVVRIGAPDDFGTRRLPAILARFAQTHSAVQVDVTMESSKRLLCYSQTKTLVM